MTIASVVSSRSKEAERSGMSSQNSVELSIPAKVEFIRLGRLVGSGLAAQAEFSVDEIEDIRIAVDELCATLVEHSIDGSTMVLTFRIEGPTLRCTAHVEAARAVTLDEISTHILVGTVDEHDVQNDGDRVVGYLQKSRNTKSP